MDYTRNTKSSSKKRILKKKRDSSELADREYQQKCSEVRKAARADKAKWLERQCEDIEKYYKEYKTREVYKIIGDINRKWQPKQRAIRDSNGKLLVNMEASLLVAWLG